MCRSDDRIIAEDWFRETFGALYPIVYAHRTVAAARPEAQFAVQQTALRPGERALDLCCGNGRHMAHLLAAGASVVGLDYSPELLDLARQDLGGNARLVRGDMRRLPFLDAFDVVFNFFTSFGYFLDPDENERVVQDLAASLRAGGRFFIDYLNAKNVQRMLVPHSVRNSAGFEIRETRWIDVGRRRVCKTTVVVKDGRPVHESGESVRLYTPDEFEALLGQAGLSVDRMFGDYSGATLDEALPRMIMVGHKP